MMLVRLSGTAALIALATPAFAADDASKLSIGFGLAASFDLPDPSADSQTKFGPGPSLQIPIRYALSEFAFVRGTVRADVAFGNAEVSWPVGGSGTRAGAQSDWSMLAGFGATIGPEFGVHVSDGLMPYIGAEGGVAWVGTYNNLGGSTQLLLDPDANDLGDTGNVDPYTTQAAVLVDLHAGVRTTGKVGLSGELGYSNAYLAAQSLKKTESLFPGQDPGARREAYGWNALRIGIGMVVSL